MQDGGEESTMGNNSCVIRAVILPLSGHDLLIYVASTLHHACRGLIHHDRWKYSKAPNNSFFFFDMGGLRKGKPV
jgi:hypothetical protein